MQGATQSMQPAVTEAPPNRSAPGSGSGGQSAGAPVTVRLHPIVSGHIELRVMSPRPPRRGPLKLARTLAGSIAKPAGWYPVPLFLVEHPSQGALLFDVGYDPSVAHDPAQTLGVLFGRVLMRHRPAERTVWQQLEDLGVDPAAISLIVMSHLHLDHASGSRQWPHATFVVDATEHRAAFGQRGPGPYVPSHLATIRRWRQIDYDAPPAQPFAGFSRTVDLFGDGSVRLISTPGHSAGHQSMLLRLRDRYALLCGDAVMSTVELRERVIDGLITDQDRHLATGDEIRGFMRSHPRTVAIPSHDAELFNKLAAVHD